MVDRKEQWEHIYATKNPDQVSWFEPVAALSLSLIEHVARDRDAAIVDVGAGASTLVDGLISDGYHRITVLDISPSALERARQRLGDRAMSVAWREADILSADLAAAAFDVWHDRAVFHFLTAKTDRARYFAQLRRALRPHGHAIVATFAEDGPASCSGLDVVRYSPNALHREFGSDFRLVTSSHEMHRTPRGTEQAFTYCVLNYEPIELGRVR